MDIHHHCRMQHRGSEVQSKLYIRNPKIGFRILAPPVFNCRNGNARTL